MSFWDPLTCRACLVTEVKLFDLHQIGLADLFGFIAGAPVEPSDGLPQYVCYYCRGQLLKFKEFRQKCRQTMIYFRDTAHVVLNSQEGDALGASLLDTAVLRMVPTDKLSNLDKTNFSIPLSKTSDLILDYVPKENNLDENEFNYESVSDTLSSLIYSHNDLIDCDGGGKKNLNENNVTAEPFKELNKEQNVKKQKKKQNKQKSNKKLKKNKIKCNKYNEKFEKDFEEFSKQHNVRVVCLTKEEQVRKVQERKESKEYKDSRFSCDVCYKGFMSGSAHKRHMKAHDPSSGSFTCEVCQMRYPTQRILNTHARTHKKIFVCTLCDQVNIGSTRAKLHSGWHKGIKFECEVCHKQYNANTTYLSHVREAHKPVTCAECGATLLGTNQLSKHRNAAHKHVQNECSKCAVAFQSSEALQRHLTDSECSGKTTLKLKPCIFCGENFSCRSSLTEHTKREHSGKRDTYTCEQCRAVFTSDRALSLHFANAHYTLNPRTNKLADKKEYLCEWCAKSFPTSGRLELHHRLHSDERPYKCSICLKRLKTKAGLEFHMNTHTGQRPYKCRLCSETFKSHAHRHNHKIMKHTTRERRHKCPTCDKSFVMASDRTKHVRYVHLRQPRPHQLKLRKRTSQGAE